jgi:hypothetical protein
MANNKQVTAEYFDFKDAVSDQNGIKPACRLCGKIVAATWQGREGSREKGLWNAINLQHHLIEWHNTEWTTKIHPRMKFKLTPNKRSSAPGNTTEKLHKLERVATESVNFSCFWCGVQMTQRGIINHRRYLINSIVNPYIFYTIYRAKGFGGESGCKHFGGLYKTSHLAPELNAAIEESKRDQMTAEELELQQATNLAKFKSYISEGIDTIPVCKEDVNRTARGIYCVINID